MSEYQRDKGVLEVLSTNPSDFEEIALTILKKYGHDTQSIDKIYKESTVLDFLKDYFYDEFIISKKVFARIIKSTTMDIEYDFCDLINLDDGVYAFHTMYYNGGTCMSEMIAGELDKLF